MKNYKELYNDLFPGLKNIGIIQFIYHLCRIIAYLIIQIFFTFVILAVILQSINLSNLNDLIRFILKNFRFLFHYIPVFLIISLQVSFFIYWLLNFYLSYLQNKLINELLTNEFPGFKYLKDISITKEDIDNSNLFFKNEKNSNSTLICYGTISGSVENIPIRFGDISLDAYKRKSIKKVLINTPYVNMIIFTIKLWKSFFKKGKSLGDMYDFTGLFFIADFNKKIKGYTIVLPDYFEKKIGIFAKILQELNFTRENLVYMEDIEFEKEFVVYSTDQIEARYILSTSLMSKITELKKRVNKPLLFSFKGNKMYMCIADSNGFLSLKTSFNTIKNNSLINLYENIKFCIDIVEELNLNRQIWA